MVVEEQLNLGVLAAEMLRQFIAVAAAVNSALLINRTLEKNKANLEEISRINLLVQDLSMRRVLDRDLQKLGQLNSNKELDSLWAKESVFAIRKTVANARQVLLPSSQFRNTLGNITQACNDWLEEYEWNNRRFKPLLIELSEKISVQVKALHELDSRVMYAHPGESSISLESRRGSADRACGNHGIHAHESEPLLTGLSK